MAACLEHAATLYRESVAMAIPSFRVVVVDDDAATMDMLCHLLTDEGYHVRCCSKHDQVITIIRSEQPDLVILDLRLAQPGRGWTILRAMRQDPLLAGIRVIVCTADSKYRPGQAEELRALGCDVVFKPFEIDELCAKVDMTLRAD